MNARLVLPGLALGLFVGLGPRAAAQEKEPKLPERAQKARQAVEAHMKKVGGTTGQVVWKDDKALEGVFPEVEFFAVRFRIYPIAREMPEGMKPSNVFAIGKGGKAEHLKDGPALEKYFKAHAAAVKDEKDARAALAAWLALSQEFHQDGFYKFEVAPENFVAEKKDGRVTVRGRALVKQGGNGEMNATLTFDDEGKLASGAEKAAIREGPRPICHATLLLDANPLVRRIAERDLLIMGVAARDYLDEQRGRAGPELRREIDRVRRQIERNGW